MKVQTIRAPFAPGEWKKFELEPNIFRPDGADLKRIDEDAVRPASDEPVKVRLAHR
jgi:hypothetical protein